MLDCILALERLEVSTRPQRQMRAGAQAAQLSSSTYSISMNSWSSAWCQRTPRTGPTWVAASNWRDCSALMVVVVMQVMASSATAETPTFSSAAAEEKCLNWSHLYAFVILFAAQLGQLVSGINSISTAYDTEHERLRRAPPGRLAQVQGRERQVRTPSLPVGPGSTAGFTLQSLTRRKKKKKKSHSTEERARKEADVAVAVAESSTSASKRERAGERERDERRGSGSASASASPAPPPVSGRRMTEAERRFEEVQRKRVSRLRRRMHRDVLTPARGTCQEECPPDAQGARRAAQPAPRLDE